MKYKLKMKDKLNQIKKLLKINQKKLNNKKVSYKYQ